MASLAQTAPSLLTRLLPNRLLAGAQICLLALVLVALFRGRADWAQVPALVWVHVLAMLMVLALMAIMLWRVKGDRLHRWLGRVFAAIMLLGAGIGLLFRASGPEFVPGGLFAGAFSFIHLLSLWVLVQVPALVWRARTHNIAAHERSVRGLAIGAVLIAGFFTLLPGRLLGHWLLG